MTSQRPRRAHFDTDVRNAVYVVARLTSPASYEYGKRAHSRAAEARALIEVEGWPPALVVLAFALDPTADLHRLRGIMINQGRGFAADRARFNRHAKRAGRPTC